MNNLWLWIGFSIGLAVRWGDRAQFVVAQSPERTWGGYLRHNWIRILFRLVTTAYIFRLVLAEGWVTSEFIAFSIGVSFETIAESLLARAKKFSESAAQKLKNGNGAPPTP